MKIILLGGLLSSILCLVSGKIFIPLLKKFNFSQTILEDVKEHNYKNGTPTMGGTFVILSAILVFFVLNGIKNHLSIMGLSLILGFFSIGLIDDYLKIKLKRNLGLTAMQKSLFQLVISLLGSIYVFQSGLDFVYIPFTLKRLNLGYFSIIINVITFIATVNSVNLIDGLDGLCSGTSSSYLVFSSFLVLIELTKNKDFYILENEYTSLVLLSFCFAGSLLGFLVFNTFKASIFLGDTGSLGIGGAIAVFSIFTGNTLYIPILGIVYLITTLSVIIQVAHFKRTGKRVFLIAPLHHHFSRKGKSEANIFYIYTFITILVGVIILISVI